MSDMMPNVTRGNANHPAMPPKPEDVFKRGLFCPDDQAIAEYVDAILPESRRKQVEGHLAKCARCRLLVADVIKLQRDVETSSAPNYATQRALRVVPKVASRAPWILGAATACAVVIVAAGMLLFIPKPQQLSVVIPSTTAPVIAKSLPPALIPTISSITRKLQSESQTPVVLAPAPNSTITSRQLEIKWKPLVQSRYYQVTVVTADGDLLWEGRSESPSLRLPSDLVWKRGSYFVWITAHLDDGQTTRSSPVRFLFDHR